MIVVRRKLQFYILSVEKFKKNSVYVLCATDVLVCLYRILSYMSRTILTIDSFQNHTIFEEEIPRRAYPTWWYSCTSSFLSSPTCN